MDSEDTQKSLQRINRDYLEHGSVKSGADLYICSYTNEQLEASFDIQISCKECTAPLKSVFTFKFRVGVFSMVYEVCFSGGNF
jgi:hypothetical protein